MGRSPKSGQVLIETVLAVSVLLLFIAALHTMSRKALTSVDRNQFKKWDKK